MNRDLNELEEQATGRYKGIKAQKILNTLRIKLACSLKNKETIIAGARRWLRGGLH